MALDTLRPVMADASPPFWAPDGRRLYALGVAGMFRREIRAVLVAEGLATGPVEVVHRLQDEDVPTWLNGISPVIAGDRILLPLASFRGDVWVVDLPPARSSAQ